MAGERSMTLLFVTGTSTDVGKTIVTAALAATATAAGRSVAVCKPAQTGVAPYEPGDLATIAQLSGVTRAVELARYPEPLAPDTAARRCGAPLLTIDETLSAITELTADLVLVEGAGGLLVRIGEFTVLDLAAKLAAPVVVVTAPGLGTLNHTELTTRTLAAGDLPRVTGVALVGTIPAGVGTRSPNEFRADAAGWFDAPWAERYLLA
jgi:dethiobiotin synthetase